MRACVLHGTQMRDPDVAAMRAHDKSSVSDIQTTCQWPICFLTSNENRRMKPAFGLLMAMALSTANTAPATPLTAPHSDNDKAGETRSSDIDWDALAAQWQGDATKTWPLLWGGALSPLAVVLTDQLNNARLITREESRAISVEDLIRHQLPLPGEGLSYGHWDDKPALAVDPTLFDVRLIFELVLHEAFHFHVQFNPDTRWPVLLEPPLEITFKYPMQIEPRLFRRMLQHSLLKAYVDVKNRSRHLAAAAWWQQTWAANFPGELAQANQRDVIEGTAQYVGVLGAAMRDLGDPDSLQERHAYFASSLRPLEGCRDTGHEHYDLGGIAGLLLDDMRVDWMRRGESGETPAEIVLDGIAPSSGEEAPEYIRSTVVACVQKLAAEAAPLVDKSLADMRNPMSAILEIPRSLDDVESKFESVTHNYRADGIPYSFFGISEGVFTTPAGTVTATNTALYSGTDGFLLPLNPAEFDVSGRQLTLKGPTFSGTLTVETIDDPDGRVRYRADIGARLNPREFSAPGPTPAR